MESRINMPMYDERAAALDTLDRGVNAVTARGLHRIEHRSDGQTTVVGHTSDVYARQQELSLRAAQLLATAATGELVLVEEATGRDVARRSLWPESSTSPATRHHDGGQHDIRDWLGGDARSEPSWSPPPLPNQHRFASVET
jgi:hypothetical protein